MRNINTQKANYTYYQSQITMAASLTFKEFAIEDIKWSIPATPEEKEVVLHNLSLLQKYYPTQYTIVMDHFDTWLCLEIVRIRDAQVAKTSYSIRSTTGQAAIQMFEQLYIKYELPIELRNEIKQVVSKMTDDPFKMNNPETNVRTQVKQLYMMLNGGKFIPLVEVKNADAIIEAGNKILMDISKNIRAFIKDGKILLNMYPFRERLLASINSLKLLPPEEGFVPKEEDDHLTVVNSNVLANLTTEQWEKLNEFINNLTIVFDDLYITRIQQGYSDDYPRFSAFIAAGIYFKPGGSLDQLIKAINTNFGTNAKMVNSGNEAISAHITLLTVPRA